MRFLLVAVLLLVVSPASAASPEKRNLDCNVDPGWPPPVEWLVQCTPGGGTWVRPREPQGHDGPRDRGRPERDDNDTNGDETGSD